MRTLLSSHCVSPAYSDRKAGLIEFHKQCRTVSAIAVIHPILHTHNFHARYVESACRLSCPGSASDALGFPVRD